MDGLRLLAAALLLSLASCTTGILPFAAPGDAGRPRTLEGPGFAETLEKTPLPVFEAPRTPDLASWPLGWVTPPENPLGMTGRFWSQQRLRWSEALDPAAVPARKALRLEQIARAGSADEALLAAWLAARAYAEAGLSEQARRWLDRVAEGTASAAVALERAWDQEFRLHDAAGARALFPSSGLNDPAAVRKAALLRQKLFLGTQKLSAVGADDFISTQILDREDLWAATWNGNIVRWSLAAGQLDLIWLSRNVAPVTQLVATAWFVYAFQDEALLRYSKVTGTWRSFPYPEGWTGLRVQAAVKLGEESLLVANLGQGLWRWDRGEWLLVDDAGGGPFLNALAPDGKGGYWVGSKDRGLWSWSNGVWSPVPCEGTPPTNISVIEDGGQKWFIGTWGEGSWLLENGRLSKWSDVPDYVTSAAWTEEGPLWGALDQGVVQGRAGDRRVLGAREGLPPGVTSLVNWQGRWIWGTGQGWVWWSEHENSALLR